MMHGYGNGYRFGINSGEYNGGLLGEWSFLIPLLIIGFVIYLVIKLTSKDEHQPKNSIVNDLKMKFINGEISEQEYLQKKKLISK